MKIPFSKYEMVGHRPGEVAHHSKRRLSEASQIKDKVLDALPVKVRSTTEKATAQRIRSQFIAQAEKSEKSILAGEAPAAMRMQAAAGDASWAGKNEQVANEALKMVRLALYNKKYGSHKSDNKFKFTEADTEAEMQRLAGGAFAQMDNFENITDLRQIAAIRSKNIWESTKINCTGLAWAVQDYVSCKYPNIQVSSLWLGRDHALSVIGTIEPELMTKPLEAWPRHIFVCDPWSNIVCPAPEYPTKFVEKMKKWEKGNKLIRNANFEWIRPTNEQWLSCVKAVPAILTRLSFTNGQFVDAISVAPLTTMPTSEVAAAVPNNAQESNATA